MSIVDLSQIGVLITRPKEQSVSLSEKIQSLGGHVWLFPTVEIEPVLLEKNGALLSAADLVIFTSQNAVIHAIPYLSQWSPCQFVAAVGSATAHLLESKGIPVTVYPKNKANSEALLSELDLKNMKAKQVVILSGEGGRDLLANTLRENGAMVTKISVYQRVCTRADPTKIVENWQSGKIQVVLGTSAEIVGNLQNIFIKRVGSLLFATPLVVASPRIYAFALSLGFSKEKLILAENASDEAMIKAIAGLTLA